jgi:CRP-like cAMP-binding protein
MRQGDPGDSFFMVAHGGVRVSRTDDGETRALATLGPGAILGEMALVTRAPRSATVTALGDVDSIEIPVAALARVAGDSRAVAMALDRFTRDRLLRNALSASALFEPFWPAHAGELLPLFEPREYAEGDRLLAQGEPGRGAFLLLSGSCAVRQREEGEEGEEREEREEGEEDHDGDAGSAGAVAARTAGPGDLLGETCLLGEGLATATVTATQPGLALVMERAAFDLLLEAHPEAQREVDELDVDSEVVNAFATEELEFPPEGVPSDAVSTD